MKNEEAIKCVAYSVFKLYKIQLQCQKKNYYI